MTIEYDARKAVSNLSKHGISFEEAASAMLDSSAVAMEDLAAANERRWILIGMSNQGRLLTVIYTLRDEDKIRLISARKATRKEAQCYG